MHNMEYDYSQWEKVEVSKMHYLLLKKLSKLNEVPLEDFDEDEIRCTSKIIKSLHYIGKMHHSEEKH